jgi:iron complex transport system substrate-binding protein
MQFKADIPRKIICLTEESVETLALLGKLNLVQGVSIFVKRPVEAQTLPKVSAFTSSQIDKIVELKPDLVLGFSDIQKDIARDLIGAGINVWISNHRTLQETFNYVLMLASIVGEREQGLRLIDKWQAKVQAIKQKTLDWGLRPRVYFEEWDEPMITAIRWVSELIEICGGDNIFKEQSLSSLAKDRIVDSQLVMGLDPQVMLACWCGKRVKMRSIYQREKWQEIDALKNKRVFELPPEIFLQPGPALFEDGLDQLFGLLQKIHDELTLT